jgi:hypothetical protein
MTEPVSISTHPSAIYAVDHNPPSNLNRISWGAIFAGAAIALTVQFLLNLLGVGIGAAVIDPARYDNPDASTFSIGSGIWFVIAGLIGAFAGGYVSSRLLGRPIKSIGGLHGLTSWAVTTLILLYLLTTSVGALVGGAVSGLSTVVSGAGRTAASVVSTAAPMVANATTNPLTMIEQQIRGTGTDPEAMRTTAVSAMKALMTSDKAQADAARAHAANALSKAQGITVDQAKSQIATYEKQYATAMEEAKRQTLEAAQTATKVISAGAFLAFVALVLGAIAGWVGGYVGTTTVIERRVV